MSNWVNFNCPSFSVKEELAAITQEQLRNNDVLINEISQDSILLSRQEGTNYDEKQKVEVDQDDHNQFLMQLTESNKATVFKLLPNNREEIELISDIDSFDSPIIFKNTGFTYQTDKKTFQTNSCSTIGI